MHLYIPYRCKVEQPDVLQHNGMINSETKSACGSKEIFYEYLEAASHEDGSQSF